MFCLHYFSSFLIFFLWLIVDAHLRSPFDVRIDHYKVDTIRDLVINTPRPRFSWKIRLPDDIKHRNVQQTAYQMQLQSTKLSQHDKQFQWDSEKLVSSQSTHVPYTGHTDLSSSTYFRFRVRVWITNSEDPSEWTDWIQFRTPIFNLHEYLTKNANPLWIGSTQINMNELRKEFLVPNTSLIKSAIVYICGVGYYEFYLNGNKVDPSRKLDPGWTDYPKRTLLASFDVTANITVGMNAVGAKLGYGWFGVEQYGYTYGGRPRLLFTLLITFENGDEMQVLSDQTWTGREGSIRHDSVWHGEIYDSRNDRPGWTHPGFNDSLSAWIMPEILPSPLNASVNGSLVLQDMPPIREGPDTLHFEITVDGSQQGYLNREDIGGIKGASLTDGLTLKPVSMWQSESGVLTFDLGQNMAGLCRLRFHGSFGSGTYIRHAEVLVQPVISTDHSTRNINIESLKTGTANMTFPKFQPHSLY